MNNSHIPQAIPNSAAAEMQLVHLMDELITLMEREITVVETRLTDELPELVARKQRLLVDYQAEFKSSAQDPSWLAKLSAQQKSLLQRVGAKFTEVSERNAMILKAASTSVQRLLHSIMASVREEKCSRAGYSHPAQQIPSERTNSVIFKTTA